MKVFFYKVVERVLEGSVFRPGVAGAVLLTVLSFIHSFIHTFIHSSFSSKSSKHHNYWIARARELKFWENVYPQLYVMYHISYVTCHMLCVTCHLSHVITCLKCFIFTTFIFLIIFLNWYKKYIVQSDDAIWWRVCYQLGHPRSSFTLVNHLTFTKFLCKPSSNSSFIYKGEVGYTIQNSKGKTIVPAFSVCNKHTGVIWLL